MKRCILILALLLALGVGGYSLWGKGGEEVDAALRLSGNVDIRSVNLSFRVGGRLASVAVGEGATVVPGELLAATRFRTIWDVVMLLGWARAGARSISGYIAEFPAVLVKKSNYSNA